MLPSAPLGLHAVAAALIAAASRSPASRAAPTGMAAADLLRAAALVERHADRLALAGAGDAPDAGEAA